MKGSETFERIVAERMLAMLYCAAANSDTPVNRRPLLRRAVNPALARYQEDKDGLQVVTAVKEFMPAGWEPKGDYAARIGKLEAQWPTTSPR